MEASLTCAVCLGLFEEPVTLPLCSHNFCRRCVQGCSSSPGDSQQQVCCPLCRKVSSVPGGAQRLPVNTTLVEVVKFLQAAPCKDVDEVPGGVGPCPNHPTRQVLLFCRTCHEGVCGHCVSEKHQGPFHSINLMDVTYQEEKLAFFSLLKKLREAGEKIIKEISDISKNIDDEAEMIASKFDEITRMLDLKKKQMLESIATHRSKKAKEQQLWTQMKDGNKRTVMKFLDECNVIIDECDPQSFLKVACDLNKRMNVQLELLDASSSIVAASLSKPVQLDIKPILDAISAMQITSEDGFKDPFSETHDSNGKFTFQKSKKRRKVNHVSETLSKLQQKINSQVAASAAIDFVSESKPDPCMLYERKLVSDPINCDQKSTLLTVKIEKPTLTRQACFDESSDPVTSTVGVHQLPSSISDSAISVQLFHPVCGSVVGITQCKSVTQPLNPTPLDTLPVKTSENRLRPSEGKPLSITFKPCPNVDTFNTGREIAVRPKVRSDDGTPKDERCNVLKSCRVLSTGSSAEPIAISAASVKIVSTGTETTVGNPILFKFGDSKRSSSTIENSSQFHFTLAESVKSIQASTKLETKSERKEKARSMDEEFSAMTLLAPNSKTLNATVSKSLTNFQGKAEMGPKDKKTSLPLFSSNRFNMKPEYPSPFLFGCITANTTVPSSSTTSFLPSVSVSNVHECHEATKSLGSTPVFNLDKSSSVYASPGEGFASNSLFTLPYNMTRKSFTPCASTDNVPHSSSNCVSMITLARENGSLCLPLSENLVEINGTVHENNTFVNDTTDALPSLNSDSSGI